MTMEATQWQRKATQWQRKGSGVRQTLTLCR